MRERSAMSFAIWPLVLPIISILVGILVIVKPKLLPYIVGGYLVLVGVVELIRYLI
jgi:uncharacterized membrane protein HdeD (DUF308 family)